MYLRVSGNSFVKIMSKGLLTITDQAKLLFGNVEYDEKKRLIVLPVERFKVLKKRRFHRAFITRKYEQNAMIKSTIIVRNVSKCHVENNVIDPNITFVTLLFGITIRENEVLINSIEEDRGKTLYSLDLEVSELDIEISDEKAP